MIKKLTIGSLLLLSSAILTVPNATAQASDKPNDTRIEKYEDLTETELDTSNYEVEEDVDPVQSEMKLQILILVQRKS